MIFAELKRLFENRNDLLEGLYSEGFVYTNERAILEKIPEICSWNLYDFGKGCILVHPKQKCTVLKKGEISFAFVGHAYDPVSMEYEEERILESLSDNVNCDFFEKFNRLTGVFTFFRMENDSLTVIGDPSCMQTTFYYAKGGDVLLSSHTNLIGQLKELCWDPYVKKLVSYRFFNLLGNSLPGNITQFAEVKRIVPNFEYCFENGKVSYKRFFYPKKIVVSEQETVDYVSSVLHNNLELISKKWNRPAISLTGGCDSKTTLACANGLYDKFEYFSYQSSESERVDVEAAKDICKALGLEHKTYLIPDIDDEVKDVVETSTILRWNTGDIRNSNANDVRKRSFLKENFDYDVEVKSWASEIGRAYYSKRFNGRTEFGDPSPRKMTTLYKFFFHNRKLVKETDNIFKEYAESFFQTDPNSPVEWQDQFFWEFRVPSWNGLVITGEHRYSFDITIPYNNRLLLNCLLSVPISARVDDEIYKSIRAKMNPDIDKTGISVQNLKHTKRREKLENLYYTIHSRMFF